MPLAAAIRGTSPRSTWWRRIRSSDLRMVIAAVTCAGVDLVRAASAVMEVFMPKTRRRAAVTAQSATCRRHRTRRLWRLTCLFKHM